MQSTPTTEEIADAMLLIARSNGGKIDVFPSPDDPLFIPATFDAQKAAADLLVQVKFAKFADEGRTQIALTNAGRYWAMNGGYMAFLKEPDSQRGGGGGRERNPELETLRLQLMRLRLDTFWWTFGLSVAGFVISIVSLVVALALGDRILGR